MALPVAMKRCSIRPLRPRTPSACLAPSAMYPSISPLRVIHWDMCRSRIIIRCSSRSRSHARSSSVALVVRARGLTVNFRRRRARFRGPRLHGEYSPQLSDIASGVAILQTTLRCLTCTTLAAPQPEASHPFTVAGVLKGIASSLDCAVFVLPVRPMGN